MRPETNRYKQRTDYTRPARGSRVEPTRAEIGGLVQPIHHHVAPAQAVATASETLPTPKKQHSDKVILSFTLPLPNLSKEQLRKHLWRTLAVIVIALVLLFAAYRIIWYITHL